MATNYCNLKIIIIVNYIKCIVEHHYCIDYTVLYTQHITGLYQNPSNFVLVFISLCNVMYSFAILIRYETNCLQAEIVFKSYFL